MDILSGAASSRVDAVTMEFDSGGMLEVAFMTSNVGNGFALERQAARELIDALW